MPWRREWRVKVTEHALMRWGERDPGAQVSKAAVIRRLRGALRSGVRPRPDLGIEVELGGGMVAIAYPTSGGWVVPTVIRRESGNLGFSVSEAVK